MTAAEGAADERTRLADFFDMKWRDHREYLDELAEDTSTPAYAVDRILIDLLQDVANTIRFNETGHPRNMREMGVGR